MSRRKVILYKSSLINVSWLLMLQEIWDLKATCWNNFFIWKMIKQAEVETA